MDKEVQERIIQNEKEWRRHMLEIQVRQDEKINKIDTRMDRLEIKVAAFGSFFGVIGAYLAKVLGFKIGQ